MCPGSPFQGRHIYGDSPLHVNLSVYYWVAIQMDPRMQPWALCLCTIILRHVLALRLYDSHAHGRSQYRGTLISSDSEPGCPSREAVLALDCLHAMLHSRCHLKPQNHGALYDALYGRLTSIRDKHTVGGQSECQGDEYLVVQQGGCPAVELLSSTASQPLPLEATRPLMTPRMGGSPVIALTDMSDLRD